MSDKITKLEEIAKKLYEYQYIRGSWWKNSKYPECFLVLSSELFLDEWSSCYVLCSAIWPGVSKEDIENYLELDGTEETPDCFKLIIDKDSLKDFLPYINLDLELKSV